MIGSIFNSRNALYNNFIRHHSRESVHNLLVLTILTENFKLIFDKKFNVNFKEFDKISKKLLNITLTSENESTIINSEENMIDFNLESILSETNFTCDFKFIFGKIGNLERILLSNLSNQTQCQIILSSYCSLDSTVKPYNNDSQTTEDTIETDVENFCDLFINNYDNLVITSFNDANTSDKLSKISSNDIVFSEYFYLFDFILSVINDGMEDDKTNHRKFQFDFIVLDFKNISSNYTTIVWRPFLILQQSQMDRTIFIRHPVQPAYKEWIFSYPILHNHPHDIVESIWSCGFLCWSVVILGVFLLIGIIVGSITFSIAIR